MSTDSDDDGSARSGDVSRTGSTTSPQTLLRPIAGGTKRPLMTHTKDGQMLSEKKLRRLEKNRLSARECRRRKREATENLERQINLMEAENLRLRLQMQIGEEAEESMQREQQKFSEDIDELLKSGASEAEIYVALESFKEKHADYGRDRRTAIEFHLRNIERLLKPTTTTSVVMQAIQGGSSASSEESKLMEISSARVTPHETSVGEDYSPAAPSLPPDQKFNPKTLFRHLVSHLEVTPAQAAALKDSRFVAQELDGCLDNAEAVLKELRERLAQTGEDLETEFNNVRNILSPTQAAKFLVWVANNSACMHMLNELWERVYPADATCHTVANGEVESESP
jgi:hypothetical protein